MNNPGIEIAWGGGRWPNRQKKVARPTIQTAIDFNSLAIEEIGFDFQQPKKVNIWRCARSEADWASSDGPTDIDVYIRVDHIKHRKVGMFLAEMTIALGHELTHAIRSEHFDDQSLVEHIASEGLAHVAEDTFSQIVLGSENAVQYFNLVSQYSSESEYAAMRSYLYSNRNYTWTQGDTAEDETFNEWLEVAGSAPPPGIIVGVNEVQKRLAEGNTIVDLMTWPAEQILDLSSPDALSTARLVA